MGGGYTKYHSQFMLMLKLAFMKLKFKTQVVHESEEQELLADPLKRWQCPIYTHSVFYHLDAHVCLY